jgi:SAM-dependent methyltransferase
MSSSSGTSHPSRDHRPRRETVGRECLLCGGPDSRSVFEEFGIDIVRCRACGHVFSTYAGDPHYDGFWGEDVAEGSESRYWDRARAAMYQDFLNRFVAGRAGRLLDMGCGLGYFVKAMAVYPAWEAHGCEISEAAVRYSRETLGLSNVVRARLEEVSWPRESFDIITIWDVLDHLQRPDPLLKRCHELLTRDGICFIRTPNVSMHLPRARLKKLVWGMRRDIPYLQARDHFHHYSTESIRRLLDRNGFSRVEFVHLRPVDSISSSRSTSRQVVRKVWFDAVRGLAKATGGRVNLDNLFVVAQR